MFFRNLTLFRFSEAVAVLLGELSARLAEKPFRACGPLEQSTRGFVSPHGSGAEALTHAVGNFHLFALGGEDKLLPASVVNNEVASRIRAIAEREQRRVGAKERKRIKDDVLTDLLPRAFARPFRQLAYVDLTAGWLVVDTGSRRVAEELLSEARDAIGTFPAAPMAPAESARALMTSWVVDGRLPEGFALGDEVELRDPAESGAVVRCRRQDLETDEVREHLKTGKQVYALALTFDDRLSFVLGEDLSARKLRFLDAALDELGNTETDTAAAELDARFALMTLELSRLLERLDGVFGLPRPTDR